MSATQQYRLAVIFLDTDKHVSPFEPLAIIDLFPDVFVLTYSNVDVEDVRKIVQDAMFPRGPKGVRFTKIFVGGSDVAKVEKIVEILKQTMFPPFEMAVLVDPRGNNTTAAAAVAKVLQLSLKHGFGDLKNKNITILAGTGPVGFACSVLASLEGAYVTITSRVLERAQDFAQRVNKEVGAERARGVKAATPEEFGKAIEDADYIIATGAPAVRLLTLDILKQYGKKVKVIADVNAVPPTGIEGLEPSDEDKEIVPGVYGVGALRVGVLKNAILIELFKKLAETRKGILDYRAAFEGAKTLIAKG
ncbi:MAG: methylene-tetrahydromethanopterin dehydrogenase N-terminal domain-containing protein [Ignisphaera sp.]